MLRSFAALSLLCALTACSAPAVKAAVPDAPAPAPDTATAYVLENTEVQPIRAKALGRDYDLFVSLPKSYGSEPKRRYPVVFVTDANYAFPLVRGVAHMAGRPEGHLGQFILVGLSYAKGDTPEYSRRRDYTPGPTRDRTLVSDMPGKTVAHGGAEGYRRFIADEVFPFVASHYRADMGAKTFAGHSYGGLLGAHILLTEPTMFEHYVLSSPSLWFGGKTMFQREAAYAAGHKDLKADVYMTAGGFETLKPGSTDPRYNNENDLVGDMRDFERLLVSRHYPGLRIKTQVLADEDHLTVYPSAITRGLTRAIPARP